MPTKPFKVTARQSVIDIIDLSIDPVAFTGHSMHVRVFLRACRGQIY